MSIRLGHLGASEGATNEAWESRKRERREANVPSGLRQNGRHAHVLYEVVLGNDDFGTDEHELIVTLAYLGERGELIVRHVDLHDAASDLTSVHGKSSARDQIQILQRPQIKRSIAQI